MKELGNKRRTWAAVVATMLAVSVLWVVVQPSPSNEFRASVQKDGTTLRTGLGPEVNLPGKVDPESGMLAERVSVPADEAGALHVGLPEVDACAAVGTSVVLVVDGQVVEKVATDAPQGLTMLGTTSGGWIVAWSSTGGLRLAQRGSLVGEVELLPTGSSAVEGRLESSAGVALEDLELELVANGSPLITESSDLEAALTSSVGDLRTRKACVDAEGTFRVRNLLEAWSGVLRIDDRHCFVPSVDLGPWTIDEHGRPFAIGLDEPRTGLRLRVERAPCLEGRLVWSEDGQPVAGAEVRLNVTCIPQSGCPPVTPMSDSNGAFRVVLPPRIGAAPEEWWGGEWRHSVDKVMVEVAAPEGARVHFIRDLREIMPDGDLGVLEVPRGERLSLRIVDSQGTAVRGAVGVLDRRAVRGDDEGLMTLTGCLPGGRISIGARGFDRGVLELDEQVLQARPPRDVVLLPGTDLSIEVRDSLGRAPEGLLLSAVCDWDFVGRPIDWSGIALHDELTGAKCRGAGLDDEGFAKLDLRSVDDGRFVLLGARPQSSIAVIVRDPSNAPLLEGVVAAPQIGQGSVVRLNLTFSLGRVSGRVTGADGGALSDAMVRLTGADGTCFARSDADGWYRLPAVRLPASNLELHVERQGYAPTRVSLPQVDLDQELAAVVLLPAHRLRVRVLDADGQPVVGAYVAVEFPDGANAAGAETGAGEYLVEDVAAGPCVVVVQRGPYTYRRPLVAHGLEEVVDVPSLAALEVLLVGEDSGKVPGSWLTLEVLSLSGERVVQGPFEKRDGGRRCTVLLEPGRYRVRAERALMVQDGIQREPITPDVDVVVLPGGTTHVTLE